MAKRCSICGKKIGLMNPYAQFRDALVCESCAKKYGAPLPSDIWWALVDTASIAKVTDLRADIEAIIAKHRYSERLEAWSEISNKIGLWLIKNPDDGCLLVWKNEFVTTYEAHPGDAQNGMYFDDTHGRLYWGSASPKDVSVRSMRYYFCPYGAITGFEVLENNEQIAQGGIGRAVVGGLLFGGAGAIVGGITGRKQQTLLTSMKIKIERDDPSDPVKFLPLYSNGKGLEGGAAESVREAAHSIATKLQQIVTANERGVTYQRRRNVIVEIANGAEPLDLVGIKHPDFPPYVPAGSSKSALPEPTNEAPAEQTTPVAAKVEDQDDSAADTTAEHPGLFCPVCGSPNPQNAHFCTNCGNPLPALLPSDVTPVNATQSGVTSSEQETNEEQEALPTDTVQDESPDTETVSEEQLSDIDRIRRYKELFDEGILTEEEFSAKKRQILGI